jgi:hypothetical protein
MVYPWVTHNNQLKHYVKPLNRVGRWVNKLQIAFDKSCVVRLANKLDIV